MINLRHVKDVVVHFYYIKQGQWPLPSFDTRKVHWCLGKGFKGPSGSMTLGPSKGKLVGTVAL